MYYEAEIVGYDGRELVVAPTASIDRDLLQKQVGKVMLRLVDGREITREQQKKAYALMRDISLWNGDLPEYIKEYMKFHFCMTHGEDWFSLRDVDRTTAKDFINYLVNFCFYHNVPTRDTVLNLTDDIEKYLYLCLEHRKCAICNAPHADVHHVDRIGMGFDREKVVHVGLKAVALCRKHHEEAHWREKDLFDAWHIYGIPLDKYLCQKLNLNTGKEN